MKILQSLIIIFICAVAQIDISLSKEHQHLTHSHSEVTSSDGSEDFDHVDVSASEYEHRHSPDGPVHQHRSETVAAAQGVLPSILVAASVIAFPIRVVSEMPMEVELQSLEICPPRRPPRV